MPYSPRERFAGKFWENQHTIKNHEAALSILRKDSGCTDPIHLRRTWMNNDFVWEIVVPWFKEGSSGHDYSGEDYYEVDPAVAIKLKTEGKVLPHKNMYLGGSTEDPDCLVISGWALSESYELDKQLQRAAMTYLVIGEDTDLAGHVSRGRCGREDTQEGRFYVDFETTNEQTCRIYPESGERVRPFPSHDPSLLIHPPAHQI